MREVLRRHGKLVAGIAAILLFVLACTGAFTFAAVADQISWDCGGGSCATNDWRSIGLGVAVVGTIAASVLGAFAVGLIAPAIALAGVAYCFRRGLDQSIAAGFTAPDSVGGPMTITMIAYIVSALCLVGWVVMLIGQIRYRRLLRARTARGD